VRLHRAHGLAGVELQTSHLRVGLRTASISTSFSLVVLPVLDELTDGVVWAVDLVMLGGEGLEEEGGEGGGGDVLGGEPEDVSDLFVRIELGLLSHLKRRVVLSNSSSRSLMNLWQSAHDCDSIQSTISSSNKQLVRTSGPSPSNSTNQLPRECGSKPMISAQAPLLRAMSRGVLPFLSRVVRACRFQQIDCTPT